MTFKITKSIEGGIYSVTLVLDTMEPSEESKISKFGPPIIDIAPVRMFRFGAWSNDLPVTLLPQTFKFEDKDEANEFYRNIKEKILETVSKFKRIEDNFSGEEDIRV